MDRRPRILSVDNHLPNQKWLSQVLEPDADVHTASTGQQALRMLESLQPELILLDIDMPGIDGFQTCRSLRANPRFALTPVIFISALIERDEQLAAFQSGADDFIPRPVDPEILRAKVTAQVQRHRRQQLAINPSADNQLFDQLRLVSFYLIEVIKAPSLQRLIDLTLDQLDQLGLKAAIWLHKRPELLKASSGSLTDLEIQLLSQTFGAKPQALGGRFVLGSAQAALLVQNMPRANTPDYTRLQEALLVMFDALSIQVKNLLVKLAMPEVINLPSVPPDAERQALVTAFEQLEGQIQQGLGQVLQHLTLMQQQGGVSLYERTQLAVLDTRVRQLHESLQASAAEVGGRINHWLKSPSPQGA